MARLPQPGGDSGNWGDVLNDYLSQSLASNGSIKPNAVDASALAPGAVDISSIQDGQVAEAKLSSAVQTKLNTPANIADGSITKAKLVTSVQGSLDKADSALQTVADASTTQKGLVQLTGDLGGTAASPTVIKTYTKSDVGLASVDNTADSAKPVSTAQQSALNLKAPLASPTFTGTVSGVNKGMVGLANVDNTADTAKPVSTAQQTALDLKAPLNSPTFTGTVSGVTKAMVGLGNVDNTSDATKNSAVATLSNKRITRRVDSVVSTPTYTFDADSYDAAKITAQASALIIANPSGTPTAMQSTVLRIKDDGVARAVTYGNQWRAIGVTLPAATVISKTLYLGAMWNSDDSKWDVLAVGQEA